MKSKTFRLFISSTFSDFSQERRLLQTYVFPEIKRYCSGLEKGYTFQPIDLRWGVSNEAQLDQKTLGLCIEEVKNSKTQPHPNFLIMAGDRYGWVPLPYAIEKDEFEKILESINKEQKQLLTTWYKLDYNQLPASYIIKQREDNYEDFNTWVEVENKIRDIFQASVKNLKFNDEQKSKYFTSATEHEVLEGVFKYIKPTPFQCDLKKKDDEYETLDFSHVYGYIRDIDTIENNEFKSNFIDNDTTKVKEFKSKLQSSIKKENLYQTNINLSNISKDKNNGSLKYRYEDIESEKDSKFVQNMIAYLKSSIDSYDSEEVTQADIESFDQERYKESKLNHYISRENDETRIHEYINDSSTNALVVYGKSGLGKSALISQAIDQTTKDKIYRFVGSTSSLNSTPSLLISILSQLDIKEEIKTIKDPQTLQDKPEDIEEFYYRVNDHLVNITKELVIFIDAIDQVENEDKFLWLPSELPSNLKIIISTLKDDNYQEDSKYLESLLTKTGNSYELEPFKNSEVLIKSILNEYDRTISETQQKYLQDIYEDINSPLYLTIAAQEMRHWSSYDDTQTLANTQQGIIKEYMENLTTIYHHDKKLIKKVFSYIYLADGLSESELLEILSVDEEFINYIAPDTYHNNITGELPVVVWARLYSQIREFLKLENKDGYDTMNFFHREFKDSISKQEDLQEIHEEFIELIQKLIVKYQDEAFDSNRLDKLYVEIIVKFHVEYEFNPLLYSKSKLKEQSVFLTTLKNTIFLNNLLNNLINFNYDMFDINKVQENNTLKKIAYYIGKFFYKSFPCENNIIYYKQCLNDLIHSYQQFSEENEASILLESMLILEKELYKINKDYCIDYISQINYVGRKLLIFKKRDKGMFYIRKFYKLSTLYDKVNSTDEFEFDTEQALLLLKFNSKVPRKYVDSKLTIIQRLDNIKNFIDILSFNSSIVDKFIKTLFEDESNYPHNKVKVIDFIQKVKYSYNEFEDEDIRELIDLLTEIEKEIFKMLKDPEYIMRLSNKMDIDSSKIYIKTYEY